MLDDILLNVHKPGRYIGREWNLPKKDFARSYIKFALCFPDLYEVGMSNLGIRIIYGILNNMPDVACERFFACAPDMKKNLRDKNMGICSLESGKAFKEFDFIGFSLGHELSYTNVLDMLQMGAIPLQASLRDHSYPLVIAGGPCVLNPEPMSDFFDLFVFGEAEEVISEIIDLYRSFKGCFKGGEISKEELLIKLAHIEGIYVPSLYEVTYTSTGTIEEFRPRFSGIPLKIKKRFIKNLDTAYFPQDWLMPYIQIVHDRITLEIMRGCPNTCRFCQARYQYFPFRQRGTENILELAANTYKRTGYDEISLCGLSVSDFVGIEGLLRRLIGLFKEKAVSISLPSIKPKAMLGDMLSLIATIKKTGLTFAPEAGTERMRSVLNKNFDIADFFKAIEQAYLCGYQNIKLYFMVGLPLEKEEDLDGIVELSLRVSQLRKQLGYAPAQVSISINTLITKPHTPFQWFRMESLEGMRSKQDYLKKKIKNRKIKLSLRNPDMTFLEGVLSRGDRRLGRVILSAFAKGAGFDAWDEYFSLEKWQEALRENQIDPDFYLGEKSKEEFLPWDFLDTGVNKEALAAEADKVIAIR